MYIFMCIVQFCSDRKSGKNKWHNQNTSRDMTKPTKWMCAQRRLRSAWASAQSDQSLRCPHEALSAQRRLIRLAGCPGWSESSLGAQPHCWFCHVAAHTLIFFFYQRVMRVRIVSSPDETTDRFAKSGSYLGIFSVTDHKQSTHVFGFPSEILAIKVLDNLCKVCYLYWYQSSWSSYDVRCL